MTAAAPQPDLAQRLRDVVVSIRDELDVSRHVFRAGPAYVVRDPVSFQTHCFEPADYRILNAIEPSRTLGDTFEHLTTQGILEASDEEAFYEFILELHQRSLLSLPVSDGAALFKRFERRRNAERLSKLLGVFFLRVPLINPDRLLTRTRGAFAWLFTLPAFIAWLALAATACFIAFARWGDLAAPVLTAFDGGNLFMLWGVLVALKIVHEFGHAYACKTFGGHVPEMGAMFVLFTPLAYMDATDSWSFTKTRRRAIVTLGGVYFESIVGVLALIVWALTEPSTLNTLAYQVVLLATVTTALFNLNPLLRYDAYYLVSDLAGIPNLRARCQHAVASLLKRTALGLRADADGHRFEHHPALVAFGLAQLAYRVLIMVTIATVLIMKFGGVGLVMASILTALTLGKAISALVRYILTSPEVAGRRVRAVTITAGSAVSASLAFALVPVPWPLDMRGVATLAQVSTIHAPQDGVLAHLSVDTGDRVSGGDPLARLDNPRIVAEHDALRAQAGHARALVIHASALTGPDAMLALASQRAADAALAQAGHDTAQLDINAPDDLRVVDLIEPRPGTHLRKGDPILRVARGPTQAVFFFRADQFESLAARVGDEVACRSAAHPGTTINARITSIAPAASRTIDAQSQDAARILAMPIHPTTGVAAQPYVEVRLDLDAPAPFNSTLHARFPSHNVTTLQAVWRRVSRFGNQVRQGFSAQ